MSFKLLDFVCQECSHIFESLVEPDEKPSCVRCKSPKTAPKAVQGYGWYAIPQPNASSTPRMRPGIKKLESAKADWGTHWAFQDQRK